MEKVVLKVNVVATERGCKFVVNNREVGEVFDYTGRGRSSGKHVGSKLGMVGMTYTEALEYVSDGIEFFFGQFGIDVEFVTLEGEK